MFLQVINFSSTTIAVFIGVVGILSILAQVTTQKHSLHLIWNQGGCTQPCSQFKYITSYVYDCAHFFHKINDRGKKIIAPFPPLSIDPLPHAADEDSG